MHPAVAFGLFERRHFAKFFGGYNAFTTPARCCATTLRPPDLVRVIGKPAAAMDALVTINTLPSNKRTTTLGGVETGTCLQISICALLSCRLPAVGAMTSNSIKGPIIRRFPSGLGRITVTAERGPGACDARAGQPEKESGRGDRSRPVALCPVSRQD